MNNSMPPNNLRPMPQKRSTDGWRTIHTNENIHFHFQHYVKEKPKLSDPRESACLSGHLVRKS
jgi:hypothetical protein